MDSATVTVDKSNDRVKRMFASIAPRYDLMNHVLSLNIDRTWRERMVQRVPPRDDHPVLDVCTGTGDLALAYSRAVEGRLPIVGTDFCPEMLACAREKSTNLRHGANVQWVEADTQSLPFEDDHFQLVVVAFGIRNVQNTDRGIREMVRVCRPGGQVGILEFSTPTFPPFRFVYQWYFRRLLPVVGHWLARNDQMAYDYLPTSVSQFPHGEAMAEHLRDNGLIDVHYHPFTLGICTLYIGTKRGV